MEELKEEISEQRTFEDLTGECEKVTIQELEEKSIKQTGNLQGFEENVPKTTDEEKIDDVGERNRKLKELAEKAEKAQQMKLVADAEARYIGRWEWARYEQIMLSCDLEIRELRKTLENYRIRVAKAKRVHDEVTKYLTQRIASTEEKIVERKMKHERERRIYETDIWSLQVEIDELQRSLTELKKEHRRNQEFIDAYEAGQEARRKRRELEEHMRRSAIRIQAWWRGVMVRRKLGPYRPEEKKKKRASKTKK